MEWALGLSVAGYVLLAAGLGLFGHRVSMVTGRKAATLLAAITVTVLLGNALIAADHPLWARLLPIEDVWLWSNPTLPGAALLVGLLWRLLPPIAWQRAVLALALLGLGVDRSLAPLFRARPALGPDRWTDETCRQSTKSTCAPAAAAAALGARNIHSTEAVLSLLALTTDGGTTNLGLYRALRRQTRDTNTTIAAYRGETVDLPTPAVVVLAPSVSPQWFTPGGRHAVAVLRREPDGTLVVADPYSGTQRWSPATLRGLWTGNAWVLIARTP